MRGLLVGLSLFAGWWLFVSEALEESRSARAETERETPSFAEATGLPDGPGWTLDPAPYRARIEAIDARAFAAAPARLGDAERVAREVRELSEALREDTRNPHVHQAATALLMLSARLDQSEGVGYALPSAIQTRLAWESWRDHVFAPAEWMRHSTPDLDRAQKRPPAVADPRSAEVLAGVADALEALSLEAESKVERLGEIRGSSRAARARNAVKRKRWAIFDRQWDARIDDALAPLGELAPPPTYSSDRDLHRALENLSQAAAQLRRVAHAPRRASWEARFADAADRLHDARALLARHRAARGAPAREAAMATSDYSSRR